MQNSVQTNKKDSQNRRNFTYLIFSSILATALGNQGLADTIFSVNFHGHILMKTCNNNAYCENNFKINTCMVLMYQIHFFLKLLTIPMSKPIGVM
jgi:hypothetical protein